MLFIFSCQSGECIDKKLVCDGTPNCADAHDEAVCCKAEDFQCPGNQVCIPAGYLCDGWEHCADGADESGDFCHADNIRRSATTSDKKVFVVILIVLVLIIFFIVYILQLCRTKFADNIRDPKEIDQASAPLSPGGLNNLRVSKISSVADAVRLSTLNSRNSMNSYDRNNITGASSSTTTNGSLIGYPSNPPPSPATTSTLHNSYPYKHYKVINKAPPTTPCR